VTAGSSQADEHSRGTGLFLGGAEGGRHEFGDARVRKAAEVAGDRLLVSGEGHALRARRILAIKNGAVFGNLAAMPNCCAMRSRTVSGRGALRQGWTTCPG